MSVFDQVLTGIKETLRLTEDVRLAGDKLKDLSQEIREHDRRITRLEAQWETAIMLSGKRLKE
jgi:hypothetical protein